MKASVKTPVPSLYLYEKSGLQESVAMENRAILKEEIDIKEEGYIDLIIDTTASNITPDCALPESNHSSNISHSKLSKQVIDLTSNDDNVCIGIDDSLQVNPVKGTFSLETIGSKTLVIFRRLPRDQESKAANEEVSECPCPKCESVFSSHVLLSNHITEVHSLDEVKKKILEGRYIKICSKCNTPTESNSVVSCTSCSAEFHYKCQQCNQTFRNYEKLSHHLLMQCSPEGYYHCPQCDYMSIYFNFVHRHVLRKHPDLGSNFDLHSIVWKDMARDTNGLVHSMLTCSKCNIEFSTLRTLNKHISRCRKIQVFKSIGMAAGSEFRIDENALSQVNGRKIVLHCGKCNKDTEFYHYIRRQPICTKCKSVLVFKCTLCDTLMTHNVYVEAHLKSICNPQQKQYSCRFCAITFHSSVSLSEHEEQHERTSNQLVELPSERRSLCPTGDSERSDASPDKSISIFDNRKNILSNPTQEKKSSIFFASQKYDAIFAEKGDLTRQPKYCDKKLRMQCKVLLAPLKIHKS